MVRHGLEIDMVATISLTVPHFSCINLISSVRGMKMALGTNTLQPYRPQQLMKQLFNTEMRNTKKLKNIRFPERQNTVSASKFKFKTFFCSGNKLR